ncbi:MAG TPA: hypothetical protein VFG62_21485 [Rhodopila sp.]|jgi:hypothetical protein|nr:hypothetical protein [Rhodopila sp.]
MTNRKKRPIKADRPPPRRGPIPEVPTVADGGSAQTKPPADDSQDTAEDEAIRRMIEAAYT